MADVLVWCEWCPTGYAHCPICDRSIKVKKDGTMYHHGHPARRCPGAGKPARNDGSEKANSSSVSDGGA